MKKLVIKKLSYESFAKFGFWMGVILGLLGVIFKIIFPQSQITAGIPFFSYGAERTFFSLILFFFIAVIFTTFDFVIIVFFINLVLKIINGLEFFYTEE